MIADLRVELIFGELLAVEDRLLLDRSEDKLRSRGGSFVS